MEQQVADLVAQLAVVAVLGGDDDLRGLLAHFFQNLIQPLIEQVAGVRPLGGVLLSVPNDGGQRVKGFVRHRFVLPSVQSFSSSRR